MDQRQSASISFPNSDISFIAPTWDEMAQLSFEISRDIQKSGATFDRIVTLAKGGWPMTRSMVDFLRVTKVVSVGVSFYAGINQRLDEPRVYQDIPVSVAGESVLLFDDVVDTGESLLFVTDYLKQKGVSNVITASLYYKPHSKMRPDYFGAETSDWIIFPYDVVETIDTLSAKWHKESVSTEEMRQRFEKLGFAEEWISHYAQL